MPFFVIKKGLVLLEWKYFPTPKIIDPQKGGLGHLVNQPSLRRPLDPGAHNGNTLANPEAAEVFGTKGRKSVTEYVPIHCSHRLVCVI
jgi:hypothetical protein